MNTDIPEVSIHTELGVDESVILSLRKKCKRDKNLRQLFTAIELLFSEEGSYTKFKREIIELNKQQLENNLKHSQTIKTFENQIDKLKSERDLSKIKEQENKANLKEIEDLKGKLKDVTEKFVEFKSHGGKESLISTLNSKISELEASKLTVESREKMLFEIRKENCDLNTKNNQLESTLSILKGKEKIMDQKVMFHQGHSDYLQKELDNKINEFSEYRVQKSTEITMLGSQNEMLQKNIRDLMSDKEILNTKVEKLSGQVKVEEEKIMELNKAASENETNYKKDLSENLLMSDFYQTKANNADERVQTLEEKLEKAETALREIKSEKEDIKGRYEFNEKEMKEKLSTLERQIEVYENHHEALEQLDPSSEIGSFNLNLVDPKSGKPYVKMISDFYILESKLKSEEENCLKLKEMLDILVKEYELKALDYENVERYSEELLIKLDRALTSEKRSTDQLKETYQKYEDLTMECIYIKDKVDKLEIIRRFYENQIEVLSQNTKIDESIGEQYHANTTLQPGDTNSNAIRLWGDNEMQNVLGNNFKLIRGDDEVQDRGTKCDNNLTEMEIQNILKINQELKIQVANETQRLSDAQKEIRELKKVANKDYDSSICNDMDESEDENENLQMDESNPELIDVDFNKSKKAHNEKIEFLNKQIDKMAAEINIKTESIAHLEASLLFAEVQNKTKASQYETIIEEAAELKVKVDSLKDEVKEKDERYYKLNENFDKIRTQIAGDKTMLSESTIEIELLKKEKHKTETDLMELNKENIAFRDRIVELQHKLETSLKDTTLELKQKDELIDALKRESAEFKGISEKSKKDLLSQNARLEREIDLFQDRVNSLSLEKTLVDEKLLVAESDLANQKKLINSLTLDKEKVEQFIKSLKSTGSVNEIFLSLRNELAEAKDELQRSRQYQLNFQNISKASEEALDKLSVEFKEYKLSQENESNDRDQSFKQQLESYQQLEDQFNKLKKTHLECLEREESLASEINRISSQLTSSTLDYQEKVKELELLRGEKDSDFDHYQSEIQLINQRIEEERSKHSQEINSILSLKEKNEDLIKGISDAKSQLEIKDSKHQEFIDSFKKEQDDLYKKLQEVTLNYNTLININESLLKQREKSNLTIKSVHSPTSSAVATDAETPDADQLNYDIIHHLRREKEFALAKNESLEAEINRIKIEKSNALRDLELTRASINNDGSKGQDSSRSSSISQQLDDKIKQINQLNEKEIHLKLENQKLLDDKTELGLKLQECKNRCSDISVELQKAKQLLENKNEKIKNLEQDNERWINRAQQILNSERVDPSEHERLKEKLEVTNKALGDAEGSLKGLDDLKKQLEESKAALDLKNSEIADLENKVESQSKMITKYTTILTRLRQQKKQLGQGISKQEELEDSNSQQLQSTDLANPVDPETTLLKNTVNSLKQARIRDAQIHRSQQDKLNQAKSVEIKKLKDDLEQLRKEKNESEAKLKELEMNGQAIESSKDTILSLEAKIKDLESQVSAYGAIDKEKAGNEIDNKIFADVMRLLNITKGGKESIPGKIAYLIKLFNKYKKDSSNLESSNASNDKIVRENLLLKEELSNIKAELENMKNRFNNLQSDKEKLLREINDLKAALDAKIMELDTIMKEKEQISENLKEQNKVTYNDYKNQINRYEQEILQLKSEIKTLKSDTLNGKTKDINPPILLQESVDLEKHHESKPQLSQHQHLTSIPIQRGESTPAQISDLPTSSNTFVLSPIFNSSKKKMERIPDIEITQNDNNQIGDKRKSPSADDNNTPEIFSRTNKKTKEDIELNNDDQAKLEDSTEIINSDIEDTNAPISESDSEDVGLSPIPGNLDLDELLEDEPTNT